GLKGAELVFNPSATVKSLSRYLWELEQPAHAVANGYWIGAINRVGVEKPLNEAQFYGSSYFCDPRGRIIGKASETEDEVLVCDLDMDMNREVRNTWQFLRDRRLRHRDGRRRLGRDDDDRRLRGAELRPDAASGSRPVAQEGAGQGAHRLRLSHDRARDQRFDPQRDGHAGQRGHPILQALHGLPRGLHARRCGNL